MTPLLLVVALTQAAASEIFVDRGETYVRMGVAQGLSKGVTLEIVSADEKTVLGRGVVLEVWSSIARINLDAASTAFKGRKEARLRAAGRRAAKLAPIAPPPPPTAAVVSASPPPPLPPPLPAEAATALSPPPLVQAQVLNAPPAPRTAVNMEVPPPPPPLVPAASSGALSLKVSLGIGALAVRRVMVSNQDAFDWHDCRVILPDGRAYAMPELRSNSDDGIMLFRFESSELPRDPQGSGTVRCHEGEGRFAVEL